MNSLHLSACHLQLKVKYMPIYIYMVLLSTFVNLDAYTFACSYTHTKTRTRTSWHTHWTDAPENLLRHWTSSCTPPAPSVTAVARQTCSASQHTHIHKNTHINTHNRNRHHGLFPCLSQPTLPAAARCPPARASPMSHKDCVWFLTVCVCVCTGVHVCLCMGAGLSLKSCHPAASTVRWSQRLTSTNVQSRDTES